MQDLEPLLRFIRRILSDGPVVPFLGAGASLAPNAAGAADAASLPTGRQLANDLAEKMGVAREELDIDDLIEVASCFQLYTARYALQEDLKRIFNAPRPPLPLHRFLAGHPTPLVLVTTNYDSLLESAFGELGREFHMLMTPVTNEGDRKLLWWRPGATSPVDCRPTEFFLDTSDAAVIYKMHGGLDPAGEWRDCIVTEEDYFEIGGRVYESSLLPPPIAAKLRASHLLFLRYSLRDIHVRHLIHQLRQSGAGRQHFLVSKRVARLDRLRYDMMGVKCLEMTVDAFLHALLIQREE
jgi:hypothetical protein